MALRYVTPPSDATTCVAVPSHLLGRPVHRLPGFGADLADDFSRMLAARYGSGHVHRFDVAPMRLGVAAHSASNASMPSVVTVTSRLDQANIRLRFDMALLARLIDLRYGTVCGPGANPPLQDAAASGTARRLAQSVADACVKLLSERLADSIPSPAPSAYSLPPLDGQCEVSIAGERAGSLTIELDTIAQIRLFEALGHAAAHETGPRQAGLPERVGRRVALRLHARVLDLRLSIAEVLELRPGQVIATPTPTLATVSIAGHALLRGRVHERAGKLCLTSLEFLE